MLSRVPAIAGARSRRLQETTAFCDIVDSSDSTFVDSLRVLVLIKRRTSTGLGNTNFTPDGLQFHYRSSASPETSYVAAPFREVSPGTVWRQPAYNTPENDSNELLTQIIGLTCSGQTGRIHAADFGTCLQTRPTGS